MSRYGEVRHKGSGKSPLGGSKEGIWQEDPESGAPFSLQTMQGLSYWHTGMSDPVNHPSHYTSHPSGVECIEVTQYHNFCVGNAIKYLWRAGIKGGEKKTLEDLQKARWYIDKEIERISQPM